MVSKNFHAILGTRLSCSHATDFDGSLNLIRLKPLAGTSSQHLPIVQTDGGKME